MVETIFFARLPLSRPHYSAGRTRRTAISLERDRRFGPVNSSARRVMEEAAEFRLREGLTIFALNRGAQKGRPFHSRREARHRPGRAPEAATHGGYSIGCAIVLADGLQIRGPVRLSKRQLDVLRWVADGLTVGQIADRLNISIHTADMHLRAARERLGVKSSVHAVAEAFRLGLIF